MRRNPDTDQNTERIAGETISVKEEMRTVTQDIRPLQILVLNLMPTKIETETQLPRPLGNTPLQVELEFLHTSSHESKNAAKEHLFKFYQVFDQVRDRSDGMAVTGAPVEQIPFEDVESWQELCEIMEWSKTHVYSTFHICWGAQAGLYYHDGIHKHDLQEKLFGVFPHMVARRSSMFMRGFDDTLLSRRRYRSMMAVSKGTPLNRGTCSVTSPEVVVGLRS